MAKKITETGPVGLRGIRNQDLYNTLSNLAAEGDTDAQGFLQSMSMGKSRPGSSGSNIDAYFEPQQYENRTAYADLGESQYDEPYIMGGDESDVNEIRYENQPWYDTLANGVGKMLGTAGTTFLSSLVGLPYGAVAAISEGRWSALWDNDVTQGLANADKWLEENMTNYKSKEQQESPWYDSSNLFSMNFIADDIIKNMGFTLGAAASMAVGSGGLGLMSRALGFVNDVGKGTKMAGNMLSALFSATGEGMIEARQGVEERNKLERQRFEDALTPEMEGLREQQQMIEEQYAASGDYETYREQMRDLQAQQQDLERRRQVGLQQIEESGRLMGNRILLANQGLLTLGNMIQFSKGMTKSFDRARHAAESSSKAAKPLGVSVKKTAQGKGLGNSGYELTGKNFGRAIAATKGLVTEGSEEMNQQFIQSAAGAAYNEEDVNDYWRAKLDPESYRETTKGLYTIGNILDRGFQESWGDINQWEQFLIGGLTGMAGSYMPSKIFNQDKTKSRWDPRRYGEWSGGAYNEVRDFNREYNQLQENVDDVNKILQQEDFPSRVSSMVGHTFLETQKTDAVDADNMKAWKDADDKQNIHDIQAFLRIGKLDDLRAIYQEMSNNLSDEDVENIVKSTTKEITAEEDKQNFVQEADNQIGEHQRKITRLQEENAAIDAQEEGMSSDEIATYRTSVQPKKEEIEQKIAVENSAIQQLEQQKNDYAGQKRYEGSYVDAQGNKTATNDEIREEVKHNAEELNRKLDSYLDSIDAVNRDTKGQLTKDQEENLAYLHNMGKESLVRADKIIGKARKSLPTQFLIKTDKTPEQLTKEYATSDLAFDGSGMVFNKDENIKEGYVEVDTSAMDDRSFRNFFIRQLLWGGNIHPDFAETADEKAAREEAEKDLPEEEKKKKARERVSKKWQESLQKWEKDAEEQRDTNGEIIEQFFKQQYFKDHVASQAEVTNAMSDLFRDIVDAASLVKQAGQYDKTLREYMQHPELVDRDKAKEEQKVEKVATEQQQKNMFAGKDAKQINQEIAAGALSIDDVDDFAGADLSDVTDDDVKSAQNEAQKSQDIRQKQASLKQHIQDNLGDAPTAEELDAAQTAMQMVDTAALNAEDPSDISIDMPELNQIPLDQVDPNASIEDVENMNQHVQDLLADAFNAMQEDENAQEDIPEEVPSIDDVETPAPQDTGHDAVTKTAPKVVAPSGPVEKAQGTVKKEEKVVTRNTVSEGATGKVIEETKKVTNQSGAGDARSYSGTSNASNATSGTWRSTTTRHPYGSDAGTYHEDIAKKQYGEDSKEYKRSKAIWEFLDKEGAFDRVDNASEDRIKTGDTVHFMVKSFAQEMYGKGYDDCTDGEKLYSTVIIMLNDNGEVLGDLPLAELEPSYRNGNPTQQVKELKSLQDKLFGAFDKRANKTFTEAIADDGVHRENADNLNLTFDNAKKTPLVSKVKQVMRGVVPFSKTERHTLNEVGAGTPMQLGVKVTGTTVAVSRGDKTQHKEIVIPNVGSIGQPYMMLPTPSGEKIAVPFYMKAFDAQQHKDTELYKLLSNAVYYLMAYNYQSKEATEYFKKHMDVIEGLLQVEAQEKTRVLTMTPDSYTLHIQNIANPAQKYDIQIVRTGNTTQDAVAMVNALSGIPINVSLEFLNKTIVTGIADNEKYSRDYNQVIGEIADVNLPMDTTHTVNGWFTIELAPSTGIQPSKAVTPKNTGTIVMNIGGRNVEIDADTNTAADTITGEVIQGDEEVNLRIAQIKASKPQYKDKDFIKVSIDGEVRTFDVKNGKFVKNKREETEVAVTQQQTEPQEAGENKAEAENNEPVQAEKPQRAVKSIQEIEDEMKQTKTVGRQNKDAWAAIPDDLKLRMVNENASIQLSYNGKSVVVSLDNRNELIKELNNANMAAKANSLQVSEDVKPMERRGTAISRENEMEVRRWLAKNLPSLSSEERVQFVDKLSRMGRDGGKYWGSYRAGVIEIQRNAPMGTAYHEAFHYVMDMVLSDEERKTLLQLTKNELGISDDWEAEERLAEDFRRYAMDENATGIIGTIKKWLRKLMDKMTRYSRITDATINQLFWEINNGGLAQRSTQAENFEKSQQRVLREIRNVQLEKTSWKNLSGDARSALREAGLSEAAYSKMSLEEKQQYLRCRV